MFRLEAISVSQKAVLNLKSLSLRDVAMPLCQVERITAARMTTRPAPMAMNKGWYKDNNINPKTSLNSEAVKTSNSLEKLLNFSDFLLVRHLLLFSDKPELLSV